MRYVIQCEGVTIQVVEGIREALGVARHLLEQGQPAHVFPWSQDYLFKA